MKPRELAALLHGLELGDIPSEAKEQARKHGLVLVYSPSADVVEFFGAIEGESEIPEVGTVHFDRDGLLPDANAVKERELPFYQARRRFSHSLDARSDVDGFKLTFATWFNHARFTLVNNGERYCRGIVFDINAIGGREST